MAMCLYWLPYLFYGWSKSSETIVKNDGQVTYPEFTVEGPAINFKLQNQLTVRILLWRMDSIICRAKHGR